MSTTIFFVTFVMVFGVLYFIDLLFKTCMFFPYIKLLHDVGITIKPFAIFWETNQFNRKFHSLGRFKPTLLQMWFQAGVYFVIASMIPAFLLISFPFFQSLNFFGSYTSDNSTPILLPIIPGFTLPLSQIFYYITVIFLCVIVHEMGHAVAASREKVSIDGCGIALYGIFPLTYVRLPVENLKQLAPWQQLRIYCAGIWHNVILSAMALLIMWSNHIILSPAFQHGNGVTVVDVEQGSGAAQPSGLVKGDQVFSINDCEIKDIGYWDKCLKEMIAEAQHGFCVSESFMELEGIPIQNQNILNCCNNSSDHLCFRYSNPKIDKLMCLPGRKLVEKAKLCYNDKSCSKKICLVPVLPSDSYRFLRIQRRSKTSVLYLGSVQELYSTVTVSSWIGKFKTFSVEYVNIYETFLEYLVTFSFGLAIMNLIPCYGFDGSYLTEVIVSLYLSGIFTKHSHRSLFIHLLKSAGCFMALFAVFSGLWKVNVFSLG